MNEPPPLHTPALYDPGRPGLPSLDPPESNVQEHIDAVAEGLIDPPSLSQVFRHSGWKHDRRLIQQALHRTGQSSSRQLAFASCGRGAWVVTDKATRSKFRVCGNSCHDRLCVPCARDRSRRLAANVLDHIDGKTVRFLTLTARSRSAPLAAELSRIYAAFRRLRQAELWKKNVEGGICFLEITHNDRTGQWHPHLHILMTGAYLPISNVSSLWKQITKDSYIADIRLVKDHRVAARYVTKYASKPLNRSFFRSLNRLDEAVQALHGRHLCLTFGDWRGVQVLARPTEEAWDQIGPLDAFIRRAANGDLDARRILELACGTQSATLMSTYRVFHPHEPPEPCVIRKTQWMLFGNWNDQGAGTP